MICDGSDEAEALEDLRQVIQEGLGEPVSYTHLDVYKRQE